MLLLAGSSREQELRMSPGKTGLKSSHEMEACADKAEWDSSSMFFTQRVYEAWKIHSSNTITGSISAPLNHHLDHISLTLRIWCFRELPHLHFL